MFEGFVDGRVDVGEVELRVRYAGQGVPVLLIHGHPRAGSTWHRVAPRLVERGFTVVCPDMRGYPLAVWRPWVDELSGASVESGHHMAVENPAAVTDALHRFLA